MTSVEPFGLISIPSKDSSSRWNCEFYDPQAMKLIIAGLGTGAVDSATFKILNPTSYYGYCGNAIAKKTKDEETHESAVASAVLNAFSGKNRLDQVQPLRPHAAHLAAWFEGIQLARHRNSIEVDH